MGENDVSFGLPEAAFADDKHVRDPHCLHLCGISRYIV